MDNIRGLLGISRMDRVPNTRIRELCGVKNGLNERIDEGVLWWLTHVERVEKGMIAKRVCWYSFRPGRPRKSWLDTVVMGPEVP